MPPPAAGKRMTANPVKPARYRPGKAPTDAHSSDEDDDDEDVSEHEEESEWKEARPLPKASSTAANDAKQIASNLKSVDLNQRWKQQEARERAQKAAEQRERERMEREAGFVTESSEAGSEDEEEDGHRPSHRVGDQVSSEEEEDSGSEDSDSDSDESSSEDEAPKKLLRPVFVRKDQRGKVQTTNDTTAADSAAAEAESLARRQAQADEMVEERIKLDAIARAAGKKSWDDDDLGDGDEEYPDDTDNLNPELEQRLWEARELSRLKRARQALEEREKEIAELERRRALTSEERDKEDQAFLAQQEADRKERGQMAHMQRYHHRGAFFIEDENDGTGNGNGDGSGSGGGGGGTSYRELARRDLMGARYQDQDGVKAALPEFLQVRDATKIGKKGRTKYKDMKSEDTGRWGDVGDRRGGGHQRNHHQESSGRDKAPQSYADVLDERFKPDRPGAGTDANRPSGANASALGERKRPATLDEKQHQQHNTKRPKY